MITEGKLHPFHSQLFTNSSLPLVWSGAGVTNINVSEIHGEVMELHKCLRNIRLGKHKDEDMLHIY
jgi:hypothetical protein